MPEKNRGKDGEQICDVGDHCMTEGEETRASYNPITPEDRALGISEETCLAHRIELRKQAASLVRA